RDHLGDVLTLGQRLAPRVDELQLSGRADQLADLVLVLDARHLDHDPSLAVVADLGSDLRLTDADATDAPLDDVARRFQLLIGDGLAGQGLHGERDPYAALQVKA